MADELPSFEEIKRRGDDVVERFRGNAAELHVLAAMNGRPVLPQPEPMSAHSLWRPGWDLIDNPKDGKATG
jgi:hypothetical protein